MTIAVAILVIVFGQAISDKVRNKKFVKLNEKKQDRSVAVVRSGKTVVISVFDNPCGRHSCGSRRVTWCRPMASWWMGLPCSATSLR